MNTLHAMIDAHAERAKEELRQMTQRFIDEINVKVGWMRRSDGQVRRYRNAAKAKK